MSSPVIGPGFGPIEPMRYKPSNMDKSGVWVQIWVFNLKFGTSLDPICGLRWSTFNSIKRS